MPEITELSSSGFSPKQFSVDLDKTSVANDKKTQGGRSVDTSTPRRSYIDSDKKYDTSFDGKRRVSTCESEEGSEISDKESVFEEENAQEHIVNKFEEFRRKELTVKALSLLSSLNVEGDSKLKIRVYDAEANNGSGGWVNLANLKTSQEKEKYYKMVYQSLLTYVSQWDDDGIQQKASALYDRLDDDPLEDNPGFLVKKSGFYRDLSKIINEVQLFISNIEKEIKRYKESYLSEIEEENERVEAKKELEKQLRDIKNQKYTIFNDSDIEDDISIEEDDEDEELEDFDDEYFNGESTIDEETGVKKH